MLSYNIALLLLLQTESKMFKTLAINVVLLIVQLAQLAVAGPLPPYHLLCMSNPYITISDNN